MKNKLFFMVSLDVESEAYGFQHISRALGREGSSGSVERSEGKAFGGKIKGKRMTAWRYFSEQPKESSIEEHVIEIFKQVPQITTIATAPFFRKARALITVGAFFDADEVPFPETCISSECVQRLAAAGLGF